MCYNHFEYGEFLASKLKAIKQSEQSKRFFAVFGLEDMPSLNEVLSSVSGTILIAVDGNEKKVYSNV